MNNGTDAAADSSKRESLLQSAGNHCFVCGPGNPISLGVTFSLDQDSSAQTVCRGSFTPAAEHMGYDKVTHGGIIFSLLDDVMANWLWLQGQQCFTGRADIRYRAQLPIGTLVILEGRCLKRKGRLAQMQGKVLDAHNGNVYAEATAAFMIPAA